MDFLLSLSAKAKEKLAKALPESLNRSVMYADQTLSEDDVSIQLCFSNHQLPQFACQTAVLRLLSYDAPRLC
jgi:THO complex subunit 1